MIDFPLPLQNAENAIDQIVIERAADATIGQFQCRVARSYNQVAVDPNLAEFIDHYGDPEAMLARQDMVQQGGFSAPEKAGHDRYRQTSPMQILSDAHGGWVSASVQTAWP